MRIITLLLFSFLATNLYSQYLSLDQLISIYDKDFIDINDYLSAKGWQFSESNKGENGKADEVVWGYDKTYEKASAWF